ncbi:hypothetical protein B0H14DRAFT_2594921 [Mycena olivaceomarginata]|nr:hypothetical protein B0H14DRAFT_2594921 [Mycena olivaceomarginata]
MDAGGVDGDRQGKGAIQQHFDHGWISRSPVAIKFSNGCDDESEGGDAAALPLAQSHETLDFRVKAKDLDLRLLDALLHIRLLCEGVHQGVHVELQAQSQANGIHGMLSHSTSDSEGKCRKGKSQKKVNKSNVESQRKGRKKVKSQESQENCLERTCQFADGQEAPGSLCSRGVPKIVKELVKSWPADDKFCLSVSREYRFTGKLGFGNLVCEGGGRRWWWPGSKSTFES